MPEGSERRSEHVEPVKRYTQDISTIDGVNEASRCLNSILDEMRKRGHNKVRVAVVEVGE